MQFLQATNTKARLIRTTAFTALAGIALAAFSAPAAAIPFGTLAERANITLSGEMTFTAAQDDNGDGSPDLGESFSLSNTPNVVTGSRQQEFRSILSPPSLGDLVPGTPEIEISSGSENEGFQFVFRFDRSLGGLGGDETGELVFTLLDILTADANTQTGTNNISFTALGTIQVFPDSADDDIFDNNQPFSLSFGGSIGDLSAGSNSITGSFSATFSSPPSISAEVPAPASLGLLGAGLLGLAFVRRRRYNA